MFPDIGKALTEIREGAAVAKALGEAQLAELRKQSALLERIANSMDKNDE